MKESLGEGGEAFEGVAWRMEEVVKTLRDESEREDREIEGVEVRKDGNVRDVKVRSILIKPRSSGEQQGEEEEVKGRKGREGRSKGLDFGTSLGRG